MQTSQQAITDSSTKSKQAEINMRLDKTSSAARSGPEELVPSRYALKVGEIDVMVVSDGVLPIPAATLATNVDPAGLAGWATCSCRRTCSCGR